MALEARAPSRSEVQLTLAPSSFFLSHVACSLADHGMPCTSCSSRQHKTFTRGQQADLGPLFSLSLSSFLSPKAKSVKVCACALNKLFASFAKFAEPTTLQLSVRSLARPENPMTHPCRSTASSLFLHHATHILASEFFPPIFSYRSCASSARLSARLPGLASHSSAPSPQPRRPGLPTRVVRPPALHHALAICT